MEHFPTWRLKNNRTFVGKSGVDILHMEHLISVEWALIGTCVATPLFLKNSARSSLLWRSTQQAGKMCCLLPNNRWKGLVGIFQIFSPFKLKDWNLKTWWFFPHDYLGLKISGERTKRRWTRTVLGGRFFFERCKRWAMPFSKALSVSWVLYNQHFWHQWCLVHKWIQQAWVVWVVVGFPLDASGCVVFLVAFGCF